MEVDSVINMDIQNQNPNFNNQSTEFDDLPVPPLDPLFFSDNFRDIMSLPEVYCSDLGIENDDDLDYNFTFDDDFLADDFFSDELLADGLTPLVSADPICVGAGDSESLVSIPIGVDRKCDVNVMNLSEVTEENCAISVRDASSGGDDQVSDKRQSSGDGSSNSVGVLRLPSQECRGSDVDFTGPASSHSSGNCALSPDSGNCKLDVSSDSCADQKFVKLEGVGKLMTSKRKKENQDGYNQSPRSSKFRRASVVAEHSFSNVGDDEDEKRKARLIRNRESAQLSRQRRKHYVEELEDKLRAMHSTVQDLNSKISYFMAENATLRQQLGGGGNGMCPPPHLGMFPHPAMVPMAAYPWMPAPYMVKPNGSQIPLVPIPRLKPQQPVSASKSKKANKESKGDGKTKKVASVSFLGLLFFILLFGGLVPMINIKYGDEIPSVSGYVGNKSSGKHLDRVFAFNDRSNGSDYRVDFGNRNHRDRVLKEVEELKSGHKGKGSQPFTHSENSSEPLVASLYVPRNDKLVKIDGNLIIQSVLASEKAMESRSGSRATKIEDTGCEIARSMPPALTYSNVGKHQGRSSYIYKNPTGSPRALTSASDDDLNDRVKSADGKMQEWFREGLAGPMLSSGMCTEVFHFDVLPGAIIPASPVTNKSIDHSENSTTSYRVKNRRFLSGLPVSFNESTLNITDEHTGGSSSSQKNKVDGNNTKPISSTVVSVLVDPREVGDGDGDGMMGQKSLSRIFVVVLLDSVKYVTYSCMLPLKGSGGPHLVTT